MGRRYTSILTGIWLTVAFVAAIDAVWMAAGGYSVAWHAMPNDYLYALLGLTAVSVMGLFIPAAREAFMFCQCLLLMLVGGHAIGILTYLGATLHRPLIDTGLIAADHIVGFHWRRYLFWIAHYPAVEEFLRLAYASETLETFCILWLLAIFRRPDDLLRFLLAMLIASLVTAIIASFFPAAGGYVFYNLHPENILLYPSAGRIQEHDFLGMRNGSLHLIPFEMQGIIAFPSFHTAIAVLIAWISRGLGGLWFFPILLLNAVIVISTPVDGGHYLMDVLGGLGVAWMAIISASAFLPRERMATTAA